MPTLPGQPEFSPLTLAEFEAEENKILREISAREEELARRRIERRRDEVEAELAALGHELGAELLFSECDGGHLLLLSSLLQIRTLS